MTVLTFHKLHKCYEIHWKSYEIQPIEQLLKSVSDDQNKVDVEAEVRTQEKEMEGLNRRSKRLGQYILHVSDVLTARFETMGSVPRPLRSRRLLTLGHLIQIERIRSRKLNVEQRMP